MGELRPSRRLRCSCPVSGIGTIAAVRFCPAKDLVMAEGRPTALKRGSEVADACKTRGMISVGRDRFGLTFWRSGLFKGEVLKFPDTLGAGPMPNQDERRCLQERHCDRLCRAIEPSGLVPARGLQVAPALFLF